MSSLLTSCNRELKTVPRRLRDDISAHWDADAITEAVRPIVDEKLITTVRWRLHS